MAIESLHSLGIVHHDIKPENILVDADGHCVLTDFGGSKFLSETRKIQPHASGHVVATLPYAAPEILEDTVTEEYDESIDWWSLGSTILTLLTGEVISLFESLSCVLTCGVGILLHGFEGSAKGYNSSSC